MMRAPTVDDAAAMNSFFLRLDQETKYMLYEPGERSVTEEGQGKFLKAAGETGNPLILVYEEGGEIVGYCGVRRENLRKNRHCSSLVIGVLEAFRGKGIGKQLLDATIRNAATAGIKRIELTVVSENTDAIRLYEKTGFRVEGERENSLLIDGEYYSELYMALLIE